MHGLKADTDGRFFPLRPTIGDLAIEDIAHALAMKVRFTGHVSTFYSVAEHSVHCSQRVPREDALWALLHDAAEAYLPDVARPIKRQLWVQAREEELIEFREAEDNILRVVARRFGLAWPMPTSVKTVDLRMLATERDLLMAAGSEAWGDLYGVERFAELLTPGAIGWEWQTAKSQFLARFAELYES
jgi:5'-deoxynucleotidase YfbR-like HD superfamily hydrolase